MFRCTIFVGVVATVGAAHADSRATSQVALSEKTSPIVGGDDAPVGKWPDTVAVLAASGSCTGTLVAPDVVLTAGHCADLEPTTVVADTIDYTAGGTRVAVERTEAHPRWESTYDVAVVMLAKPITNVAPRALGTGCTFEEFAADTLVHIVGFGATTMDGTGRNTVLKEAITGVIDPTCASGNGCNPSVAPGGEFIAGGTGTADSCFGDSGGPVYLETDRGPIVVGAVSRGVDNSATPCGGGGIYVRTDKIVKWVEETAGRAVTKDGCTPDSGEGRSGDDDLIDGYGNTLGGCSTSRSGGWSLALAPIVWLGTIRRRMRRARVRSGEP